MDTTRPVSPKKPANTGKLLHGVAAQRAKKKIVLGSPTTPGSGAGTYATCFTRVDQSSTIQTFIRSSLATGRVWQIRRGLPGSRSLSPTCSTAAS